MEVVTVGLLAAIDLWLAFPVAFALPIPEPVSAFVMGLGGSIGAGLAAMGAFGLNSFLQARYSNYDRLLDRTSTYLNKWGLPGIGLTSPLILGPVLTTALAIVLGADPKRLMIWVIVGVFLWSYMCYLVLLGGAWVT